MGVRRGTATPSKVYRGTVPVKKIMRGTVEVWSASIYPLSGTWTATFALGKTHTGSSHTIAEPGTYTLTHSMTGHNGAWGLVSISTPKGSGGEQAHPEGVATLTVALSPGDEVVFSAQNTDWGDQTYSGTWSIVKN